MQQPLAIITVRGYRYDFETVLRAAKATITAAVSVVENEHVGGAWGRSGLGGFEQAWRCNKETADATGDHVDLNLPRLKIDTYLLGRNYLVLNAAIGQFCSASGELNGAIDPMPSMIIGVRDEDESQIGLTLTAKEAMAIHKAITALDLGIEVGVQVMAKARGPHEPPEILGHFVLIGFPSKVFASAEPEQFTMVWYGRVSGGTTPGKPPIEA